MIGQLKSPANIKFKAGYSSGKNLKYFISVSGSFFSYRMKIYNSKLFVPYIEMYLNKALFNFWMVFFF
jgi:hypothetical protein